MTDAYGEIKELSKYIASVGLVEHVCVTAEPIEDVMLIRLRLERNVPALFFEEIMQRLKHVHGTIHRTKQRFYYVVDLCACDHVPLDHMTAFVHCLMHDKHVLQECLCSSVVLVRNKTLQLAVTFLLTMYTPVRPFTMMHVNSRTPTAYDDAEVLSFLTSHS